jgi:hypothetical protein
MAINVAASSAMTGTRIMAMVAMQTAPPQPVATEYLREANSAMTATPPASMDAQIYATSNRAAMA